MPLVEVYQMPFGLRTCLPRGCVPASVGSQAVTINSFGPDGLSASVMSKLKASYPPRCWPISLPFTQTLASKSTAPKCSSNRWPFHLWGTSISRRYQMRSFSLTWRITPDNADSTGNGTRICVWNVARVASLLVMAKSHKPLRLSQSCRTIWGRGYSGWAFSGDTSLAHRVFSGPAAGCQDAAEVCGTQSGTVRMTPAITRILWHTFICFISLSSTLQSLFLRLPHLGILALADYRECGNAQPRGTHRNERHGLGRLVGLHRAGLQCAHQALRILLPGGNALCLHPASDGRGRRCERLRRQCPSASLYDLEGPGRVPLIEHQTIIPRSGGEHLLLRPRLRAAATLPALADL